ncbi:MAG TPA: penicillin acylase family protein [Pyrinomonadaceae bacterium]|nr:penicillin acylase family protein [Pyrinomonadaceae bacterium]
MKKLLTIGLLITSVLIAWFRPQNVRGQGQPARGSDSNQAAAKTNQPTASELWRQVEIIRTAHGVPHIRAENLRAAGYALAWLQSEDYGPRTALNVLEARGQLALLIGNRDNIESDFLALPEHERTIQTYQLLEQETRDIYDGFASGLNRYIDLHPQEFPPHMPDDFSGYDVAAIDAGGPSLGKARAFLARINPAPSPTPGPETPRNPTTDEGPVNSDEGSNAWAFAPSRTRSGKAILLRNPHLAWTAGYYEAQITVPGVMDFYGDFRIGGPFTVVGGFNRYLGWSTTNNSQDLSEVYALDVDPKTPDHYLFDGASLTLKRDLRTVTFRNGDGLSTETREFWSTPLGPVIYRANGKIYIVKTGGDGEFRAGEQFLRMMRATSLAEWKEAMKLRARVTSNFTYADRAGNIYFLWNAALPLLPQPTGGVASATPAHTMRDVWTRYVPFESLPQVLNPRGGYIHNENDSPHFTNVRAPVDITNVYPNFEKPELSLRGQLAIELIGGENKLSLEDVVRLKHSYRMLLADRVKADLMAAVKSKEPAGDPAAAIALLERWDNTAAPESKGAALFELWWAEYSGLRPPNRTPLPDEKRFAKVWSATDPLNTPRGLADQARAVEAFTWAVAETARRYGSWDVAWGDVHRVRRGSVDVPVGGCASSLGCFRALAFTREADGKLAASAGDGWILAVEFGDVPRALSVLAYGESNRRDSPWFADQAEMFAKGELKKVAFTSADVEAQAVVRYRPGEK